MKKEQAQGSRESELEVSDVGSKGKRRFRAPANPMVKQLEQLQQKMLDAQAALADETVTVTVGGGALTVVMDGHHHLQSVRIDPEVVDPDDVEMLQDLIVAAVNEARAKVEALTEERLGPLTGNLAIPGLT